MSDAVLGAAPARRAFPLRPVLVGGAALVVAALGVRTIIAASPVVSTDDAYFSADISTVAPKIRGLVSQVAVRDNQFVRAGDVLVRIDPEEYQAREDVAQGDLAAANAQIQAEAASLERLDAEERLAAANVRATATMIGAADAENLRATTDRTRLMHLASTGDASRQEAERAMATQARALSEHDRSRAALDVARAQAAVTSSHRAELLAALAAAHAAEQRARGALALAVQDVAHTVIRAPVDGVIGDRHVQAGDYVQPGSALLSVVPMNTLYLTANFKETQTARMHPGQPADISVDAADGETVNGEVESLAPGSGSQFALLPFEPGTGNFTKIVQRVPVRIRLIGHNGNLRPGLSATVRVTVKD
jgi:membrane fusion protein, multidrug efflux system